MKNTFGVDIIPENDSLRIAALKRYKILDTPSENAFDNIAKLATQIFNVPISLISLIDAEEVYFKANVGMGNIKSSSRGLSLCALAVLDPEVTVFEDAKVEPCLLTNPLVAGEFGLKFYAGAPITTPDGFLIGTLCIIDKVTRIFTERDRLILKGMATLVMDDIELRLAAIEENEKQEKIQIKLAESEFRARLIINDAPVAISVLNSRLMLIESANEKMLEIWGKTTAIIGLPVEVALPELDGQPFLKILDDVFTTGEPFYGNEIKAIFKRNRNIEEVYLNFVYHPLKNIQGITNSILVVATEVTQQIVARKQMELGRQQMQNMVMNSTMGMNIFKSRELIIEMANQPMFDIWSRTAAQALGNPLMEVFPELKDQPFYHLLINIFDTGKPVEIAEIPVRILTPQGDKNIFINAKYVPIFDIDGKVESLVATIIDITELVNSRKFLEEREHAMQSINEELNATNEELAVTNEELTATNEELYQIQNYLQELMANLAESRIELQKSEDMLRISTEAAEVHTWQVDLNTGKFVSSASLKNLLGFLADDTMTLQAMNDQIVQEHKDRVTTEFDIALNQTGTFDVEYLINGWNDKKLSWLRAKGKLLHDDLNQPTHFSGVIIDITEKKLDELRKNDFIAMVSHELKTPLTSLKGYIQLLTMKNSKNADPFTTNALIKGESQIQKMLSIIDGFLNVSEMNAGKIRLDKTVFSLDELILEITKDASLNATSHQIEITNFLNITVDADRNKIGQVLNNFLSNAIKYSPENTKIQIFCKEISGIVYLGVKDEGKGVKNEDRDKLFSRFYRVDNQESTTITGFGIGLYICAEIIQRHEGRIWVESELQIGSTFYFSLPVYKLP